MAFALASKAALAPSTRRAPAARRAAVVVRAEEGKPAPKAWSPPALDANTPSPIFGGSTGGLLRKAQVRKRGGVGCGGCGRCVRAEGEQSKRFYFSLLLLLFFETERGSRVRSRARKRAAAGRAGRPFRHRPCPALGRACAATAEGLGAAPAYRGGRWRRWAGAAVPARRGEGGQAHGRRPLSSRQGEGAGAAAAGGLPPRPGPARAPAQPPPRQAGPCRRPTGAEGRKGEKGRACPCRGAGEKRREPHPPSPDPPHPLNRRAPPPPARHHPSITTPFSSLSSSLSSARHTSLSHTHITTTQQKKP
jgi:hypothetical protein